MNIDFSVLLTIITVGCTLYNAISSSKRNNKKETTEEAAQTATILTELKNILDGITDIKKEITSIKDDVKENRDRTTRLEENCKQAHKRIDEIIARIEHSNV